MNDPGGRGPTLIGVRGVAVGFHVVTYDGNRPEITSPDYRVPIVDEQYETAAEP